VSVLSTKLLRELRQSWILLLAIVSIVVVGVMSLVAMRSLYSNLRHAQREYYAQCRMADFWINLKKAPLAELARVDHVPGVIESRPRIQFYATVDLPDVAKPLGGLVLSMPAERRPVINDVVMRHGSYFTPQRDNEVIVNDAFARAHDIKPGDTLYLLLNNRRQQVVVVGTAISSEFVFALGPGAIMPDPDQFGIFYVKHHWAEEVFDMEGAANQVVGRLAAPVRQQSGFVLSELEQMLEPFGALTATALKDQSSNLILSAEIKGLGIWATILPGIFLVVAALVLNVLMSRLVEQQRTVIGTLKAIGYDDRRLFGHYLVFGLIVGLAGGAIGSVFGWFMAGAFTNVYHRFFEFPKLENQVHPAVIALGVTVSVLCALLGSLRGAAAAMRLSPAEAMRSKPPASGQRILLERWQLLWRRLSFAWRMALRNVMRNHLRTAVGVFATSMGISLLMLTFMSVEAMNYLIDFQFHKIARHDFELTFESERSADALLEAQRLPSVDLAEPVLIVPCTFTFGSHHYKGGITGLAADARLTVPRDTAGDALSIPTTGLLMTAKVAELLHAKAGDLVTVRPVRGLRRRVQVPIVQIAESYLGTAVYADIHFLSHLVDEQFAVSGVQLATRGGPDERRQLYRRLKELPALQGAASRQETIDNLNETMLESQNLSIAMLVGFAGVICFSSVLNASMVSLTERLREIATLRTLGYGSWQIGGLLLRENLLVNLTGAVLGLPLGYALYIAMVQAYDMELMRLPVVAPPWVWFTSLLLAVVFALSAHAIVQWRILRLDWLAALQVKE